MTVSFLHAIAGLFFLALLSACGTLPHEPFHSPPYHAPTPLKAPQSVRRIDTQEALKLHQAKEALFLDVMGAVFREESLDFDGAWLVDGPRADIPGSYWLPNVGKEKLIPVVERYYRLNLERLTNGDKDRVLVIYCIEDCWMSWNASKRAALWGYSNVLWYRKGVDGWKDAEMPLEERFPVDLPVD